MTAPQVHAPGELVDLRSWLMGQWSPHGSFARTAAFALIQRSPLEVPNPAVWSRWEHDALHTATLWWVAEDMVDLLLACAAAVPDDVRLAEIERPSQAGLVVFAKSWKGVDAETPGHEVAVDALLWGGSTLTPEVRPGATHGVPCLSTSMYRRIVFDDGLSADELSVALSTGSFEHAVLERMPHPERGPEDIDERGVSSSGIHLMGDDGLRPVRPGERVAATSVARGVSWAPLGRSDWPVEDSIDVAPWDMTDQMRVSFVEDRKVLVALWTLLHQEGIASRVEHGAPRAAMRRAERHGIPRELSKVQVVTLRKIRREHDDGLEHDGTKVEHDHRWLVSGHWRWQPFGKGRAERRLQFIAPYIKGPDDKPLRVRERVNSIVR